MENAVRARRDSTLDQLRQAIIAAEMPTTSIEEWRYSKIDEIDLNEYSPAVGTSDRKASDSVLLDIVSKFHPQAVTITTGNRGIEISGEVPTGVIVGDFDPEDISHDFSGADVFYNLNALLSLPLTLTIKKDFDPGQPLVIVRYLDGEHQVVFPNLCIKVEAEARVNIIEVLVSSDQAEILVVPVTKIYQESSSSSEYLLIEDLGIKSQMIGHQISRLESDASFRSLSIVSGGSYARIFTTSTIAGAGARSNLNAAYFGNGEQVLDFRTLQEHSAKNGRSELYFKGAAADRAHLVYSGLIKVDKGATSTDAFQTNKNLVLSQGARADSVPNLDIQENDVRCSHASSVGPIDQEQSYYLESRGIDPDSVQRLIVGGFFAEMAERSDIGGVKEVLFELAARKWEEMH